MDDKRSPYAAPGAKLADPAQRPGSPYKAVALGALTDLGGTFAFTIALAFIYGVALAAGGMPAEEIEQAISKASPDSWYFVLAAIGGCGFSVLGAYVCARIAAQSEYTLGAILALINIALGLIIGGGDYDLGVAIVLNAGSVLATALGAWLGKKRNRAGRRATT